MRRISNSSRRAVSLKDLPSHLLAKIRESRPDLFENRGRAKQKYNAVPVTDWRGVLYDSKTEKEWAERLDMMVAVRQIKRWSYGPRFVIQAPTEEKPDIPRITFRPDFLIWRNDDSWWVLDAKGVVTREAKRIGKLWKKLHPRNPLYFGFKDGSMKEAT